MAFTHGKNSFVEVDTLDVSAYADTAELSRTLDAPLTTAFGDSANTYIPGLKDASFTLSGSWDGAAAAIDEKLNSVYEGDALITWKYGPNGSGATSGDVVYSGSAVITDAPVPSAVGDKVTWAATLQVSGAVTRTVTP